MTHECPNCGRELVGSKPCTSCTGLSFGWMLVVVGDRNCGFGVGGEIDTRMRLESGISLNSRVRLDSNPKEQNMSSIVSFVVTAILCAVFLWVLGQFPTLDATVVKFIRIAVLVVLTLMLINVVLVLLFGQGIPYYLGGGNGPLLRR